MAAVDRIEGEQRQGHAGWRWLAQRSPTYLVRRTLALTDRYGITAARAEERTRRFVELLALRGVAPTLAVPGTVVRRHGHFARELVAGGVDLAVHADDHVDFRGLTPNQQEAQLRRAIDAFDEERIPVTGFRCPYLGYRPEMRPIVPDRLTYSSNEAVRWDVPLPPAVDAVSEALERFYDPVDVTRDPVLPHDEDGLLELPVSMPDDLRLLDGLHLHEEEIGRIWSAVLERTRARGDLFVALTHPETADACAGAFVLLLDAALSPARPTWVATLAEVADWWRRRSATTVELHDDAVTIRCDPRATILSRGLGATGPLWETGWRRSEQVRFEVRLDALPFVGMLDLEPPLAQALRREGYIVREGEDARRCATRLDADTVRSIGGPADVLTALENGTAPLLRVWRWPDGAASCLSITGDLDALDLGDYASRVRLLRPVTRELIRDRPTSRPVGALPSPAPAGHRRRRQPM